MVESDSITTNRKELSKTMRKLKIYEKDIDEKFTHASGRGGQNVNKVATCVMLHHVPSGIRVKCQKERTQALNRTRARLLLIHKIELQKRKLAKKESYEAERIKRRKRTRSLESKEVVLSSKHHHSQIKKLRHKITSKELDEFL